MDPVNDMVRNPSEDIILPDFEENVALCSDVVIRLMSGEISIEDAIQSDNPYRPFVFEYSIGSTAGTLLLSEQADLSNAEEFELDPFKTILRIDNLKTGTVYHYCMSVDGYDYYGSFQTACSPRFVSIPGTVNTRDIGGYVNLDGLIVRQGLLIRGTEIDGLVNASYLLPTERAGDVQDQFGFVYDFDLRSRNTFEGLYQSPLGAEVEHKFYTAPEYEHVFDESWKWGVYRIFADLADPDHYPMYLHCTWGKDRTGTIVYLLQGILNVDEADMMREYQLSAFTNPELLEMTSIDALIDGLLQYEGDTIQEKIVTFLTTDIGVTSEQIDSIRSIFLAP